MTNRNLSVQSRRTIALILVVTAVVTAGILIIAASGPTNKTQTAIAQARDEALHKFSAMPLYFERNDGQTDPSVRYLSRASHYSLYLTDDATVISIVGGSIHKGPRTTSVPLPPDKLVESDVRIRLVGANPHPQFEALEPLPGHVNYLIGNDPKNFHRNIPIFGRVKMKNVYPGIDLVYYGTPQALEYDLVAAPGADTSKLKFAVEGPAKTTVDKAGDLIISTDAGAVVFQKPRVYQQDAANHETPINGSFALAKDGTVDAGIPRREVSFDLASYDRSRTLVIDPTAQIMYSTYLGGTGSSTGPINLEQFANISGGLLTLTIADVGLDVSLDPSNNAYVTGVAYSNNFPTTTGAFQTTQNGANSPPSQNPNSFVSEINYSQSGAASLVYSTYIGGSGDTTSADAGHGNGDLAFGIAADSAGDAFIVGQTYSANFPETSTCGSFGKTNPQGGTSTNVGFVAEVAAGGASLDYACYINGSKNATEARVALFPIGCGSGNNCQAYVVGSTQSDKSSGFPVTAGAFQTANGATNGKSQASFLVVNAAGASLEYATLYGGLGNGTNADAGIAVAVNAAGDGFITGSTFSANLMVPGAAVTTYDGAANKVSNAYVAEFNPAASGAASLVYGTYLGGSGASVTIPITSQVINVGDVGTGIVIDSGTGDAWVTGFTASTDFRNIPGSSGTPFQATNEANADSGAPATAAFIAQIDPTVSGSNGILYSTYFSGNGFVAVPRVLNFGDVATGIALSGGKVFITGAATSGKTAGSFPLSNACQQINNSSGFGLIGSTVPVTAYVSEIDPTAGTGGLVFSTLLGGTGMLDGADGIQVDSSGNIVVTGLTYSTDFPVSQSAFQLTNNTGNEETVKSQAFLTVLDPTSNNCATASVTPTQTASSTPSSTPTGPTPTATVTVTPTPVPGGAATLVSQGSGSGKPGSTVDLGSITYTPSTDTTQEITTVDVSVSRPGIFSSLTLTAFEGGEQIGAETVTPAAAVTSFTFTPALVSEGGSAITFELSGIISGGKSGMLDLQKQVKFAGVFESGNHGGFGGAGSLMLGLGLLGLVALPLSGGTRRRTAMFAALMLIMATGIVACGGSSGGPPPAPASDQQVTSITISQDGMPLSATGLPIDLGKIRKK